jgi:uncharacterized protein (DUF1778 family)
MARKSRNETPGQHVSVRLSAAERMRLYQAANRNQQSVSAFLRDAFEEAAADCLEPDEWREPAKRVT